MHRVCVRVPIVEPRRAQVRLTQRPVGVPFAITGARTRSSNDQRSITKDETTMSVVKWLKQGLPRQLARRVSQRSREQKVLLLRCNIRPGARVLLVGASPNEGIGTESDVERGLLEHAEITCLVYEPYVGALWGQPTVQGDARNLPFPDRSFDYVVSNAVIEHVGGPDGARKMLSESRRVSIIGYLHTTPNRWFPIEPHVMLPLLHWLPESARRRAFAAIGFKSYSREHYWLFSKRTLRRLGTRASRCTGIWPAMTLLAHSEPLTRSGAAAGR